MKKKILALLMVATVLFVAACGSVDNADTTTPDEPAETTEVEEPADEEEAEVAGDEESWTIAVVPKLTSIAWFERMEEGVNEMAATSNNDIFYTGPTEGDGALQAQVIEDLIAQGVDAIAVVPFSTEALEPVLSRARDAGIVVVTHEADTMTNIDFNIEAFDNDAYGRHFMERMGAQMGGEGEWIALVGSLTSQSHMQWVDASIAYQEENFPNMTFVGDRIETNDDQNTAYQRTLEALRANPNIRGIQGSAMADVAGAALAVQELGLDGQVTIVGTSLVSVSGQFIEDGTIDMISFWDPALAGQAMVRIAEMILNGEEITEGLNLNIPGYENLILIDGNLLYGQAWIDITIENVDDPNYDF